MAVYPDIEVRISASPSLIDVRGEWSSSTIGSVAHPTEDADIAIRFGSGLYPGFRADKLFRYRNGNVQSSAPGRNTRCAA